MCYPDLHTHRADAPAGLAIVDVGCDVGTFTPCPGMLYSVGLHPWKLDADYAERLAAMEHLLQHPQVVAVGECGLDRVCTVSMDLQQAAFVAQLRLAQEYGKPVVLHVVRTYDLLLHHAAHRPHHTPWVAHGFRGRTATMRQLLAAGVDVSFGTHFNNEAAAACPTEHLFVESDTGTSTQLAETYGRIAALRGVTAEQLARSVAANFEKIITPSWIRTNNEESGSSI